MPHMRMTPFEICKVDYSISGFGMQGLFCKVIGLKVLAGRGPFLSESECFIGNARYLQ